MPVVILGCPRSGTSLLANILVKSGFDINKTDLMRPNIHFNRDGYYENINIIKVNDQLIRLKARNNEKTFLNIFTQENENFVLLSNDNYKDLDTPDKVYSEIQNIKSGLGAQSVIKDSRMVFTLDDWNLNDIFILKITRNKNDVKKSMERHYGVFTNDFDEYYATYDRLIDSHISKYGGISVSYENLLNYDFSAIESSLGVKLDSTVIKHKCNWCLFDTQLLYDVPNSRIGAKIMFCTKCELIQSHYTNIQNKHRYKSISCDSDWGNIRHGKGVRLDTSVEVLQGLEVSSILDIGSNRGDFCKWASLNYGDVSIDMIEPDGDITNYKFKYDNLYNQRFENFFKNKQYDLVYCCHTLEHIDNLREFLNKVYLFTNKYFFVDVPNITNVMDEGNIEEFFIDKHVFHFSEGGLKKILEESGFRVIVNKTDKYNIVFLCEKIVGTFSLTDYIHNLTTNRENLLKKADKLNKMFTEKKVVIYGATRILDALIKYGNLQHKNAYYIVDDFSPLENIYKFDKIENDPPDVVVILARSSIDKIKQKLSVENITFQDL